MLQDIDFAEWDSDIYDWLGEFGECPSITFGGQAQASASGQRVKGARSASDRRERSLYTAASDCARLSPPAKESRDRYGNYVFALPYIDCGACGMPMWRCSCDFGV